jgi:hypothetical protein
MNNSQQTVTEAFELAKQLAEKTRENKLIWEKADAPNRFAVKIRDGFEFTIYSVGSGGFGISMKDRDGLEILQAEVESPQYGYSSALEEELSNMLKYLNELARRSALDVDRKVLAAKGLLESL